MDELLTHLNNIAALGPPKVVLSKPASKGQELKKIVAERKETGYQLSKYTEKQVFHENVSLEDLPAALCAAMAGSFGQLNAWDGKFEYMLLLSSKGKCTFKRLLAGKTAPAPTAAGHDRKKNYLLEASADVAPLVDMGIFTKEGKIVHAMYDKYKQINRYLEIIDDAVRDLDLKHINVIDFGCGKSYLTFIVYYYLTYLKGIEAHIIGLDLKEDVIRKCNEAARRYGYENLRFELGDINGYQAPFDVDLVMTLHACDTATDFALYNAVQWGAKLIFSVPCCQHELNGQIETEEYSLLTRYGILQERFAALCTDAIRAALLEAQGYRTQVLEFIDFAHTPKNLLIRAVRRSHTPEVHRRQALEQAESLMAQFHFSPTLYRRGRPTPPHRPRLPHLRGPRDGSDVSGRRITVWRSQNYAISISRFIPAIAT